MSEVSTSAAAEAAVKKKSRSFFADLIVRLFKEKPLGAIGAVIVILMFLIGILAPVISPFPPNEIHSRAVLKPPSDTYLLGTDNYGRDLLTRIIYGARISMSVGLAVPAISLSIALFIGVISGFVGGKLDLVVQRFVDAWISFPYFLILLTIMSLTGPGLAQVIFVLGISGGITVSRTVRSTVISIKENLYVQSAVAIGCPTWKLLLRHIMPNIMPVVIILFTMRMAEAILAESALSFLGYGVPPPNPSWGGMLSGDGRKYMLIAPWMAFWPGLALSFAVFGISMLGDAIRDILDPRLKGGLGRYGRAKIKLKSAAQ